MSGLDYHGSVIPMSCEYTVIITQVCFSYNLDINKEHTHDEIVMLYYFLCFNVCTVTHWLEQTLYRRSDGHGSPWTMHGHRCVV